MGDPPKRAGVPDDDEVRAIVERALGDAVATVERFATGLQHFVYDVLMRDGTKRVARLAGPGADLGLASGVAWAEVLRPLGVPLPKTLASGRDDATGRRFALLERLPGTDLGNVHATLSPEELRRIAGRVASAQAAAAALPPRPRYGRLLAQQDTPPFESWSAFVDDLLAGVVSGLGEAIGPLDRELERLGRRREACADWLDSRPSVAFLEDTTTKNVIVDGGRFQGIVDVDAIVFGDPLLTPGLTLTALLANGHARGYVDAWLDHIAVSRKGRRAVSFYAAIFCVGFLGEHGRAFNRAAAAPIDWRVVERQRRVLAALVASD